MTRTPATAEAAAILKPYMVSTIVHSTSDSSGRWERGEGGREERGREVRRWTGERGEGVDRERGEGREVRREQREE